jgi:hypothetical protein
MSMQPSTSLQDDLEAQLQGIDTRFLLAIHHREIDPVVLARRLLAGRGLDGAGRWVGFGEAAERLGI